MKRLFILGLSLLLLAGCGTAAEPPEAPATEATAAVTTTEAPTAAPQKSGAKPFTKDDITAIEANFKTVGDYVKAIPAAWYKVEIWEPMGGELAIEFYDHEPKEDSEAFLCVLSRDDMRDHDTYGDRLQALPKIFLDAKNVEIHYIDFAKVGDAIASPRGLAIGDNAQKIFDVYPDYRTGDGTILYGITTLYPWAEPAWGNTEWDNPELDGLDEYSDYHGWEREPEYGFLGGRIWKENSNYIYVARFVFMEKPSWWDERERDYPWTSDIYSYHWMLEYYIEENTIQDIKYVLSYHPG